jgi:hypothetical protein
LGRRAHGASCQRQASQELRQEIPWEILILAFRTDEPAAPEQEKAPLKHRYFQNSNLNGVIVPCFEELFPRLFT